MTEVDVPDVVLPDVEPDVQVKSWLVALPDGSQVVLCQASGGTTWVSQVEVTSTDPGW